MFPPEKKEEIYQIQYVLLMPSPDMVKLPVDSPLKKTESFILNDTKS